MNKRTTLDLGFDAWELNLSCAFDPRIANVVLVASENIERRCPKEDLLIIVHTISVILYPITEPAHAPSSIASFWRPRLVSPGRYSIKENTALRCLHP